RRDNNSFYIVPWAGARASQAALPLRPELGNYETVTSPPEAGCWGRGHRVGLCGGTLVPPPTIEVVAGWCSRGVATSRWEPLPRFEYNHRPGMAPSRAGAFLPTIERGKAVAIRRPGGRRAPRSGA